MTPPKQPATRTATRPDVWVSPQETADHFHVSRATVLRWIDSGLLPAERVGKRLIRIRRTDLEKVAESIRTVTTP